LHSDDDHDNDHPHHDHIHDDRVTSVGMEVGGSNYKHLLQRWLLHSSLSIFPCFCSIFSLFKPPVTGCYTLADGGHLQLDEAEHLAYEPAAR
jgi:hypothetical protein